MIGSRRGGRNRMARTLLRLLRDEKGATAIEYGLIAALIALVLISAFVTFGANLGNMFNYIAGRAVPVWENASS
jgi:pilus assembly protein Flp/PilA